MLYKSWKKISITTMLVATMAAVIFGWIYIKDVEFTSQINIILTAIIAICAVWSISTRKEIFEETNRPNVIATYLLQHQCYYLQIKNVGNTPAYNVSFVKTDESVFGYGEQDNKISEFLSDTIKQFNPQEERIFLAWNSSSPLQQSLSDFTPGSQERAFAQSNFAPEGTITITFYDHKGRKFESKMDLSRPLYAEDLGRENNHQLSKV